MLSVGQGPEPLLGMTSPSSFPTASMSTTATVDSLLPVKLASCSTDLAQVRYRGSITLPVPSSDTYVVNIYRSLLFRWRGSSALLGLTQRIPPSWA